MVKRIIAIDGFNGDGFILSHNVVMEFDKYFLMGVYDVEGKTIDDKICYFETYYDEDEINADQMPYEITVDEEDQLDVNDIIDNDRLYWDPTEFLEGEELDDYLDLMENLRNHLDTE